MKNKKCEQVHGRVTITTRNELRLIGALTPHGILLAMMAPSGGVCDA